MENYSVVPKNIKELSLDDGKNITKPNNILVEMRRFYQSLYNSKTTNKLEDSNLSEFPKEFNILDNDEKLAVNKEIPVEEL